MAADKPLRMLLIGSSQDGLALQLGLIGEAKVQGGRGEQADAGVPMVVVVPREESLAKSPRILD